MVYVYPNNCQTLLILSTNIWFSLKVLPVTLKRHLIFPHHKWQRKWALLYWLQGNDLTSSRIIRCIEILRSCSEKNDEVTFFWTTYFLRCHDTQNNSIHHKILSILALNAVMLWVSPISTLCWVSWRHLLRSGRVSLLHCHNKWIY